MHTKYVDIDGTAVHYLHTGPTTLPDVPPALDRGALFVLLHAAGSNAGMWRRQLDGLAAEHSVVALDLPGHGRSSGIDGPASIEDGATVVLRVLDALRLRPCVLVGRSMGGAIALVVASRASERVRGLVLACSSARFTLSDEMVATARDVARGRLPQQFTTDTFSPATGMDVMREAWMEQVKTDPRVRLTDLLACRAFDGHALLPAIRGADAGRRRGRRRHHAGRTGRGARGGNSRRAARGAGAGRPSGAARAERALQRAGGGVRGASRMSDVMSAWGKVAVAGVYEHPTRFAPDKTAYQLHAESARGALADAGLTIRDVDGFCTSGVGPIGILSLAQHLNLHPRWVDSQAIGGSSFVSHCLHAAAAIAGGLCEVALVTYGSTAASERFAIGTGGGSAMDPPDHFEAPFGPTIVGSYALVAQRHMHEYGTTSEQLAEIAVTMRRHAVEQPERQVPRSDHGRGRARLAHHLLAAPPARLLHHLRRRRRAGAHVGRAGARPRAAAGRHPRRRRGGAAPRHRTARPARHRRPAVGAARPRARRRRARRRRHVR